MVLVVGISASLDRSDFYHNLFDCNLARYFIFIMTSLKRRILNLRELRFQEIRKQFPGQSVRWCRFQARTKLDGELKRKKEQLRESNKSISNV